MPKSKEKRLAYLNGQLMKRWGEPPCETITQAEKRMKELKEEDHKAKVSRMHENGAG
tara:strand:- start:276 stop:446 length:171 start_codon:yes stop_codon:yes gene_type:complete